MDTASDLDPSCLHSHSKVELTEVFDKSTVSVAAIAAIQIAVTGLASPFAGFIADEFGKRRVTIMGSVLFSTGLLTSSFAHDMEMFYVTYGVLGGLGIGLMYGPVTACVVEHFTKRRTLACGIAFCGSGAGIFAMNPILSILLGTYGWRGTFLILAAVQMNCIACGLALLPPTHVETVASTYPMSVKKKILHFLIMIPRMFVADSLALLADFRCATFILSVFFYGMSINIPYSFISKQAVDLGMSKLQASWVSSTLGISNTVSRVAIGWMGDRTFVSRTLMLKCVLVLTGIMLPTSLALTTFEAKMVSTCIIGALLGGYIALFPSILADLFLVANIGKAVGLFTLVLSVAAVVGTLVAGWTVDVTGGFGVCFFWGGGGCIFSALILLLPIAKDLCYGIPIRNKTTHL